MKVSLPVYTLLLLLDICSLRLRTELKAIKFEDQSYVNIINSTLGLGAPANATALNSVSLPRRQYDHHRRPPDISLKKVVSKRKFLSLRLLWPPFLPSFLPSRFSLSLPSHKLMCISTSLRWLWWSFYFLHLRSIKLLCFRRCPSCK